MYNYIFMYTYYMYVYIYNYVYVGSLHGAVVVYWTAMRRPGVRFPVGTVYLPSFTSLARDSKWGCRL